MIGERQNPYKISKKILQQDQKQFVRQAVIK